jgi:integrase
MSAPSKPLNNNGSIRIRFSHNGIRFNLSNLGDYYNPLARKNSQTICDRIGLDIASGNFNCTDNTELKLKYLPHESLISLNLSSPELRESFEEISLSEKTHLIEKLTKRLEITYHCSDKALIPLLQNYNNPLVSIEDAEDFIEWIRKTRQLKNSTLQRYLNTLKVISPLFQKIKIKSEPRPLPKPFSSEEVRAIIKWFENHKYYSNYADYVKFLFLTGTRTGEAIGLQWKHIDFDRNLMFIYESLGRDQGNSAKRIRKTTKNQQLREFPLSNSLLELLKSRYSSSKKSIKALVFPSPEDKAIDDHNFSQRIWKKCLKELKIEHRPSYNTRHTFISHFLEKTKDVVKCASLTHGSKSGIQTIYKNYAGIISRLEVPELF